MCVHYVIITSLYITLGHYGSNNSADEDPLIETFGPLTWNSLLAT